MGENGKVAQAFVRTSQVCAQYACATELIPDHINTIRTQTRQSKLILINASSDVGQILNICLYNTYAYGIEYIYIAGYALCPRSLKARGPIDVG